MATQSSESPGTSGAQEPTFFAEKKAAAVLKHGVLTRYLTPFAAKTGSTARGRRVVILDGYAGAGRYEDGTVGSPVLMARTAESLAPQRRLDLIFVEKDRGNFELLRGVLAEHDISLQHGPFRGSVEDHLDHILEIASDAPLFVFLDPYGLGVSFDDIVGKIFARPGGLGAPATEVLLNFSADAVRRIGGLLKSTKVIPGRAATLEALDRVCGGDWWREVYLQAATPEAASEEIAEAYLSRLCHAARCAGWSVPVRRAEHHQAVYTLVYLTRHADGLFLFGEALSGAQRDWRRAVLPEGTLFSSDEAFNSDEAQRESEWVQEISANVRELLSRKPVVPIGQHYSEIFGRTLGKARQTHLRQALRLLRREQAIAEVPKGDLWKGSVARID